MLMARDSNCYTGPATEEDGLELDWSFQTELFAVDRLRQTYREIAETARQVSFYEPGCAD
jgi:hypothetical protein